MPIHDEHEYKLKLFLEEYAENPEKVVLFIGAGLSRPLFPNWVQLVKFLIDKCGFSSEDTFHLKEKAQAGQQLLEIAQECKKRLASNYWRLLEKQFKPPQIERDKIAISYRTIFTDNTLGIKTIVTTNYDLIPNQFGEWNCLKNVKGELMTAKSNLQKKIKQVVKIHGCINDKDSLVLTIKDYQQAEQQKALQAFLTDIFSNYTVLFLGFSLSDPHIETILQNVKEIYGIHTQGLYCLIDKPPTETNLLETKYDINVIGYKAANESHPEVLDVINRMKAVSPLAVAPTVVDPSPPESEQSANPQ
jgi:hypothetical protein